MTDLIQEIRDAQVALEDKSHDQPVVIGLSVAGEVTFHVRVGTYEASDIFVVGETLADVVEKAERRMKIMDNPDFQRAKELQNEANKLMQKVQNENQ